MSSSCENESLSTPTECHLVREPLRPNADGSCPLDYEKIQGEKFFIPTCLRKYPNYMCDINDPRLCIRPRQEIQTLYPTTYPTLQTAYPTPLTLSN